MTHPIITIDFKRPKSFRYFWIKYVTGFDPTKHCARCLVGQYSKLAAYDQRQNLDAQPLDEHATPFIYICGVTAQYERNVHLAGRFESLASTQYNDQRISIEIENFRQVEITADGNPPAPREFATCRNWQFGWIAFPETEPIIWESDK